MATSSLAFPSLHHRNLDTPTTFRYRRATGVYLIRATKDSIPPLSTNLPLWPKPCSAIC
ncbi:hypothetical protein HanIR_Chr13g0643471 [Helianthus annuus]|nr:hypothetical protein HanIR_Chr13g0643471 [Helianthus annuus]